MYQDSRKLGDKMEQLLYHVLLPKNHEFYVSIEEILDNEITSSIKSNYWYSCGGKVKPEITKKLRPFGVPNWVDFDKAIGVDLIQRTETSLCFPIFTEKVMVFDKDISSLIYDQSFFEDNQYTFEEAINFDTGKSIEELILSYWGSMIPLKEYMKEKPYNNPEILLFEPVPKEIIKVVEKD